METAKKSGAKGSADGRQVRWDEHKRLRRRAIVDAAVACVEEVGPGVEVPLATIADRAGLNRSVVYRHFADREEIDKAVQRRAIRELSDALLPEFTLEASPRQIIHATAGIYVAWAAAHPSLHELIQHSPAPPEPPLKDEAVANLASVISLMMVQGFDAWGLQLSDDDSAALDPLIFGLVGGVVEAVRRWLTRPVREPDASAFTDLVAEAAWLQIAGHARVRGVELDPDVPISDLVAAMGATP